MSTYLLDVNLLLVLAEPQHVHHEAAHRWFAEKGAEARATCPLTENRFVRIASHLSYPNRPGDVAAAVAGEAHFAFSNQLNPFSHLTYR